MAMKITILRILSVFNGYHIVVPPISRNSPGKLTGHVFRHGGHKKIRGRFRTPLISWWS